MKALILLVSLLASPAFADRANDGPNGAPRAPEPVIIAEASQACGFFCREGDYKGVRVTQDGLVIAFSGKMGTHETLRNVAQLESNVVKKLVKRIAALEISPLQPENDGPGCQDAPTTSYVVFKKQGERSEIAAWSQCKNFRMKNGQGQDIKGILEGLFSLAQ